MNYKTKKRLVKYSVVFILALLGLCAFFMTFFTFNFSSSMPRGIYFKQFFIRKNNIKEGDIVAFENPMNEEMWGVNNGNYLIIKQVLKKAGDLYCLKGDSDKAYDSRYFGLVGADYIHFKVYPVYLFKENRIPSITLFLKNFSNKVKGVAFL